MQAPIRVAALLSAVWLAGCAATSVFNPYPNQATEYQKALAGGMPETALKSLDKKVTTRDGMLYRMERGRILQLTGNYEASRADFEEVGARFDQQDLQAKVTAAGSVTAAASLISNDNAIPYDGYLYERTYLHHFQVFNYLGLGDIEGATVELRKAALEQQMMEEAHEKEIAKAHAKQDDAEHIGNEVKALDQISACSDHDTPENYGAHNTPEQNPVLVLPRNLEVGKNDSNDEYIVDAQRLLNHIAGQVFEYGILRRQRMPHFQPQPKPLVAIGEIDENTEKEGYENPDPRPAQCFPGRYDVRLAIEHSQVES